MLATLVFALAVPAVAAEAPVSLTASDGSGLTLVGYDVDTVIAGPLAFTELRLAFDNPQDRVIEGRFRLVLPDGAAVSRFAMKIGDAFQEGEVVEKQAARRAYEDALHRGQDPALLEQASPNEFSARVFPIPAKGRKELIVSWSQELSSSSSPWTLQLVGLPEIGSFKARVRQGGREVLAEQKVKFVPSTNLVVNATGAGALRIEDVVVARIKPVAAADAVDVGATIVLLDTSASRGLGERGDRSLLAFVVAALVKAQPSAASSALTVLGFDQVTATLYDGTFGAFRLSDLHPRRALGASDLGRALDDAAALARAKKATRVVIVGDGVGTAGATGDALVAKAKALKDAGVKRLDAVAVGALRDDAALRRLVAGTLPEEGAVIPATDGAARVAARLRQVSRSGLAVDVAGATWVWPKRLDGVQPDDEVLVIAELPAPQKDVRVTVAGRSVDVGAVDTTAPAPLLRRAWARAKIARLLEARELEQDKPARAELADQIVKVSTTHRVLSPLTALVVLETEADYARFGIDRKALADVLVVDAAGLSLRKRAGIVVPPVEAKPAPKKPKADTNEKKKMSRAREGEAESDGAPGSKSVAAEGERDDDDRSAPMEEAKEAMMDAPAPEPAAAPAPRREARSETPAASRPPPPTAAPTPVVAEEARRSRDGAAPPEPPRPKVEPYTGPFAEVMKLLASGRTDEAIKKARGWREEDKGNILALLALGEALEQQGDVVEAGRAYGALVDLYADRADIRRLVGARLDRLAGRKAGAGVDDAARLAEDTWRRAAEDRPDHPQGPRGQAWALVRLGRHAEAMDVVEAAIARGNPSGRFAGVDEILRDDVALIAASWAKAQPKETAAIDARVKKLGLSRATSKSLRFVLWWETDANDVDFHIHDGRGAHAFYSQRELPSGGRLYADVTTGFGPECFTIDGAPKAFPYRLEAHYYARGPMGFGMGAMRVVQHDGRGGIVVEDRPFIIMVDGAYVDLGVVKGPLAP
jgi:tetratricopeptide (TPR) repeat protein